MKAKRRKENKANKKVTVFRSTPDDSDILPRVWGKVRSPVHVAQRADVARCFVHVHLLKARKKNKREKQKRRADGRTRKTRTKNRNKYRKKNKEETYGGKCHVHIDT